MVEQQYAKLQEVAIRPNVTFDKRPSGLGAIFSRHGLPEDFSKLRSPEEREQSATRIQRWYRQHIAMYAAFGPMMFSCKDGSMSDFGTISYLSGARAAQFIRVSDSTSCATLSHFLEKFWHLPRPDVLISVSGSAATLQLTANLQRVFDRGLATAAAMTNAWLFTGGACRHGAGELAELAELAECLLLWFTPHAHAPRATAHEKPPLPFAFAHCVHSCGRHRLGRHEAGG